MAATSQANAGSLAATFNATRQWPHLERVLGVAETSPFLLGAVLIGSFATGRVDALSDIDIVLAVGDGSFDEVWRTRAGLHEGSVLGAWDVISADSPGIGAHKWITQDVVLVECIVTEPSRFRLAKPYVVAVGDRLLADLFPRRAPVLRSQMSAVGLHPMEAAYDQLKEAIRSGDAAEGLS